MAKKRNPNGMGTINDLGKNRRKRYNPVVTIGTDENGKQIRKSLGACETRKKAQQKLSLYSLNPYVVENDNLTFKKVYEMWSVRYFKKVASSTKTNVQSRYSTYLSVFDDYKIRKMRITIIQQHLDEILKTKSIGTVKSIAATLFTIFEFARKNEIVDKNIIEFLELPAYERVEEKKPFSEKEIARLWEVKENKTAAIILVLIYTGMRINELLKLSVDNVDLKKGLLHVVKSKTKSGIRTIPIHPKIYEIVKLQFEKNNNFLFENTIHNSIDYSYFRKQFKKFIKEIGLEEHTIHDTRHTTATLLSNAKADTVAITEILGHSNYNFTAKVYTHKDTEQLKKAMETLN